MGWGLDFLLTPAPSQNEGFRMRIEKGTLVKVRNKTNSAWERGGKNLNLLGSFFPKYFQIGQEKEMQEYINQNADSEIIAHKNFQIGSNRLAFGKKEIISLPNLEIKPKPEHKLSRAYNY